MSLTLAPEASASIRSTSAPAEHRWELGVARRDRVIEATAEPPALLRAGPLRVLAIQRELHGTGEVRDLFTRAAEIACAECGFARALILAVQGRTLSAHLMGALRDPDNDSLRRRIQAEPVELGPGCVEADLLRIVKGGRGDAIEGWSALQRQHGLEHFALGAVVPEDEALALLVVDRPDRAVDFAERVTVQMFAQMLACSLERVIRRQRARESSSELQYMMTSASALLNEAAQAPVSFSPESTRGFCSRG